ncbi:hypothetical protein JAAARDRAFT_41389 [Jaapia argillacea MUCL 33604]|uniref:DUS-like FMN-binding domain-containing protein n=1 Tax=Jaapia argillacea MUCL 33604 TaxID=933084 RepID=A0A067P8M5_9AGAM|nr:hypothetical protein JAAARDRAFT_41389 [Jaapia argillacea MUCL 33604]
MTRRPYSPSPSSPRPSKKPRIDHLTSDDFKDGVMLAPMVRSGVLPTRLFALKHGAKLVWAPEIVDKAILHSERVVDPITGVISYNGKSRAMFTTHPLEKPYLIYQIGSSDPSLAVQAAKMVLQDVSGIDLNCGCPKPFSTHSGMGAALLSTPDLLCSILTALRTELPPHITVSAKIRLLPNQEDTLKLVEKIVNTGISALTVHCRTRNQRMKERAVIERLKEIVEFVEGMGKGIAVIANGDCLSWEDAKRVRAITGAHSVMIATAAESNPTCFSPTPLVDIEKTLIPPYVQMCKYLGNFWANTKWSIIQFRGSLSTLKRTECIAIKDSLAKAKSYDDMNEFVGGQWDGEQVFQEIVEVIQARENTPLSLAVNVDEANENRDESVPLVTPPATQNPEPPGLWAPLAPANALRAPVPAMISRQDVVSPTPGDVVPLPS